MSISRIEAMRIYEDYHCRGNSMHTSVETMAEIVHLYKDELPSWQENISEHDETVYDFDDDEFLNYKKEGKEKAKETTGYKDNGWNKVDQYGRAITDSAVSIGNAGAAFVANGGIGVNAYGLNLTVGQKTAEGIATNVGEKIATKTTEKAADVAGNAAANAVKNTGEAVTAETAKNIGQSASCIVACVLGAATAAAYWIKNPNKDQVEASEEVANLMNEGMSELNATQSEMQYMSEELQTAAEEAEQTNEEANQQILELKTAFDDSRQARKDIQTKANSGKITADDKRRYKEYGSDMKDAGESISDVSDEASSVVGDIQSDMLTYQEGFDAAAETMGTINGVTDYAAGFDSSTEVLCYVEGGAQALNAVSSTLAGVRATALATSGAWAFGATAWAYAFAVMGFVAAASSGVASGQQFKWAKDVHKEIETRGLTEEFNTNTLDMYNVEVDNYDSALDDVSSLELNLPEDLSFDDTELNVPEEGKEPQTPKKQQKGNIK